MLKRDGRFDGPALRVGVAGDVPLWVPLLVDPTRFARPGAGVDVEAVDRGVVAVDVEQQADLVVAGEVGVVGAAGVAGGIGRLLGAAGEAGREV